MTAYRVLPLVAMLVSVPFPAGAQFGGMPGLPGGEGFGRPPAAPPPTCQQLMALRDETQKHGLAIQKANERKASVQEACRLFKNFLAAETKFIKGIEEHGRTCGASPELLKQIKETHAKALQIGKDVCEAAARGSWPAGPSLYDPSLRRDFQKPGETRDFSWPGESRDYDADCINLCGKTGDFGLPGDFKPVR